jgi:hypothetical protein
LVLLSLCVSVHRIILVDAFNVGTIRACFYKRFDLKFSLYQFDTTLHNYIPCCLIFINNILIFVGINRAKQRVDGKISSGTCKSAQDMRILISLMIVSTMYVVFMMPASTSFSYQLYLIVHGKGDANYREFIHYLVTFFDEFSMLNYSFNFIIYGCTLPFYRGEVRKMFRVAV